MKLQKKMIIVHIVENIPIWQHHSVLTRISFICIVVQNENTIFFTHWLYPRIVSFISTTYLMCILIKPLNVISVHSEISCAFSISLSFKGFNLKMLKKSLTVNNKRQSLSFAVNFFLRFAFSPMA